MIDLLGGSGIIRVCRWVESGIRKTARQSLLFHPRKELPLTEGSRLANGGGKIAANGIAALEESRIAGWLYHYWPRLCGGSLTQLLFFFVPLLLLATLRMGLAGRWTIAGITLILLGLLVLLLTRKGTPADWLEGSFLGRLLNKLKVSLPREEAPRSLRIYLLLCGMLGGLAAWKLGLVLGILAAVALMVLPAVFYLPPVWSVCLLCVLLPLAPTALCWALSVLIVLAYCFGRAFRGLSPMKRDWVDVLLGMFPVLCLISTLFSYTRGDSMVVTVMWMGLFVCVFFIKRILRTRQELLAALLSLTAGATLSGLYGMFQYLSGMTDATWTDTAMFGDLSLRVYSTFANPNVFGEFLLLMIPLVTALVFYFKRPLLRWSLLAVDLLLLVNLVMTYSRGCYVGIAVTAIIFLWFYSKKWLLVVLSLGIPLGMLVMPASVVNRILSIGNLSDGSTNYRMMIYTGTLLMLADYWFAGIGIGEKAYNAIYPIYALSGISAPHSHSLFFQAAVSFGVLGLLYLLVLLIVYQREMTRSNLQLLKRDRLLMLGFASLMGGFALQSIFDYTWYNYRVFQLFWIVITLGFTALRILRAENKTEEELIND